VAIDPNVLVGQFLSGKGYDAAFFSITPSDTDPALNLDFWLSSGYAHIWNFGQSSPATSWEREIDQVMARQAASFDDRERHMLFSQAQKIFAEHEPMLYFAAPRIYVAASSRVANLSPMVRRPQGLWEADVLAVRR
jgi:ABC-type transport system substrate-binding protein